MLEYRGSFRYVSLTHALHALREAREELEDDALSDLDREWMRYLQRRGTIVHVDAVMPAAADRYIAAAVLTALAKRAIEGCVDVMQGSAILDAFAYEAST